jgi:hypothetical protein
VQFSRSHGRLGDGPRAKREKGGKVKTASSTPSRDYSHEIKLSDSGFSVVALKNKDAVPVKIEWTDVAKIEVFKRDVFAFDLICLFLSCTNSTVLELDENLKGWDEFIAILPKSLPGCQALNQWWKVVAYPAFATNMTTIFSQASTKPSTGGTA